MAAPVYATTIPQYSEGVVASIVVGTIFAVVALICFIVCIYCLCCVTLNKCRRVTTENELICGPHKKPISMAKVV